MEADDRAMVDDALLEATGPVTGPSGGRVVGWDDDDEGQEQMRHLMVPGALDVLAVEAGVT